MTFLEKVFCRRPRILNTLHRMHLVRAVSQTNELERAALAKFSAGAKFALEIGSFQGVSAAIIARSLGEDGCLYCVDPWPAKAGASDAVFEIFQRHLKRAGTIERVRIVREFSSNAAESLPDHFDFGFIDGDHSWRGIETDWALVAPRTEKGGIVCLHDTAVPPEEPCGTSSRVSFLMQ